MYYILHVLGCGAGESGLLALIHAQWSGEDLLLVLQDGSHEHIFF